MQIFEVRISHDALNDMGELRMFLNNMMSEEGAVRYANAMRAEIYSLSGICNLYGTYIFKNIKEDTPRCKTDGFS